MSSLEMLINIGRVGWFGDQAGVYCSPVTEERAS